MTGQSRRLPHNDKLWRTRKPPLPILLTGFLATSLIVSTAHAADGTWAFTDTGGSWADPNNWVDGVIADGIDAVATFSPTATLNVTFGGNFTIGHLVVTGSQLLNLSDDGSTPVSTPPTDPPTVSLTFATSSGMPTIDLSGSTRNDVILWFGRSGSSNVRYVIKTSQGLFVDIGSGTNRRFRLNRCYNEAWGVSYFSGPLIILRGQLDPQEAFAVPKTRLVLGTDQTPEGDVAQMRMDGNTGRSQRLCALDGIATSTISANTAGTGQINRLEVGHNDPITNQPMNGEFQGRIGAFWNGTDYVAASLMHVIKFGDGTQIFSGQNIYMGYTQVRYGTLLVNGTHIATDSIYRTVTVTGFAWGSYDVWSGATLGGTGLIKPMANSDQGGQSVAILVRSGGQIAPGSGGIGTLTFDGGNSDLPMLGFSEGAFFTFELGPNNTSDRIALINADANDVQFENNVINFVDLTGGNLSGDYTLFTTDVAGAYTGLSVDLNGKILSGLSIGTGLEAYSEPVLKLVGNDIVLSIRPRLLGDTNADGVVDLADYNNVVNNLGATGSGVLGDTNADGVVDLADYNNVVNNLGATAGVGLAVPEPASLAAAGLVSLLLLGRRRSSI